MKFNKRGITIISIMIAIVVISVLTATVTVSTKQVMQNTYKKEFMREYKLVKAATRDYIMRNSGTIDFEETQFDVTSISAENLQQFYGEEVADNKIEMYVIDLEKIGITNATYGTRSNEDNNDVYLLSKKTNAVYYKKGFVNGNNIYYKAIND